MANWIECRVPSGDKIVVNFDNCNWMHRNDLKGLTELSFGTPSKLRIKESPVELKAKGLKT